MNPEREEFLQRRRTGIGGSDVGAILGVDRFRDSLDVYRSKVLPPDELETTEQLAAHLEAGLYLEPVIATMYTEQSGRKTRAGKFRRHRKHKFMIGNLDRVVVGLTRPPYPDTKSGPGVLELKNMNRFTARRIKQDGVPQSHVLQLNHYMGIGGLEWGALAYLCSDPIAWEFISFEMDFDPELFESCADVCGRFWKDHIQAKVPPIPQPMEMPDAPTLTADEAVVMMSESIDWAEAIKYLREAKEIEASGKAAVEFAKTLLKELMPNHGVYEGAGTRVYYREQRGRLSFDRRSLEAMQPIDPITMATLLTEAGLDTDTIETLFTAARLDLKQFEKRGDPFTTLRTYDSKE